MNNIIPIFSSHFSIGSSILTLEDSDKIIENKPISIIAIAKEYKLKDIFLCEKTMSGFVEAYTNFKKNDLNLRFGLKLTVCNDINKKDEESTKTESNIIIWLKNSEGYKDLLKIYSKAFTDGFYYTGRIDWNHLNKMWTKNLNLCIPYFSSFLHNNLFKGHKSLPDFTQIKPTILLTNINLPFDELLREKTEEYIKINKFDSLEYHPIYYFKNNDFKVFQVYSCIHNRSSFDKPNLEHLASNQFSFETYQKRLK